MPRLATAGIPIRFNLWPYGDLGSDDCLKGGGGTTDTGYHPMEIWSTLTSTPGELDELWYRLYCNISRCNRALTALEQYGIEKLGGATAARREAEIHFLRGHSYFKLVTMFRQVPWIDKAVFEQSTHEQIKNNEFTYQELMGKRDRRVRAGFQRLPRSGGWRRTRQQGGRGGISRQMLSDSYGATDTRLLPAPDS